MVNSNKLTELIRIKSTTKKLLDSNKLVDTEIYDSVINRLLDKKRSRT